MTYSKKIIVECIAHYLKENGIAEIVISPGSRNAPFIQSFTQKPYFNCHSVIDERSAGFIALGMALEQNKPTVLICTSGSAILNYYPAVAEAFYQKIPLIIISADRPKWAVDNGQGQTIRQIGVLGNHIIDSLSLDGEQIGIEELNEKSYQVDALIKTSLNKKQPIHLNVHFDEPLYEMLDCLDCTFPVINLNKEINNPSAFDTTTFINLWNTLENKLIIVGQGKIDKDLNFVIDQLSKREDTLVLTETISNIQSDSTINSIDVFLEGIDKEKFNPHLIIQIGEAVISKKIKNLLQGLDTKTYWSVNSLNNHPEIYKGITEKINALPTTFLKSFIGLKANSSFGNFYRKKYENILHKRDAFLENESVFSDLKVFDLIIQSIQENQIIHSSNSSLIRYLQLLPRIKNPFYANRGTSGIDGSTSTAVGFSFLNNKTNYLLTGDVSFFYDSNAFWNNLPKDNLKVILINNSGGSIFRIIPGANTSEVREQFFATKHNTKAENLCKMYHVDYLSATNFNSLQESLVSLNNSEGLTLLEVIIDENIGPERLKLFFDSLK